MLKKWCQNTTLNGVSDLYESKDNKSHFVFWIIIMVTMLVLTVYLTTTNIINFMKSPTVTKVDTVAEGYMDMPDYLLCYDGSLNVVKMKDFNLSDQLISILQNPYVYPDQVEDDDYLTAEQEFTNFLKNQNIDTKEFYEQIASHDCLDIVLKRRKAGDSTFTTDSPCNNVSVFIGTTSFTCLNFRDNGRQYISNAVYGGSRLVITSPKGGQLQNVHEYHTNSFTLAMDKIFYIEGDKNVEIPLGYKITILITLTKIVRLPKRQPCLHKLSDRIQTGWCHTAVLHDLSMEYCNCSLPGMKSLFAISDSKVCSVFEFNKNCIYIWDKIVLEAMALVRNKCPSPCEENIYSTSISFSPLKTDNITVLTIGYSHLQYTQIEEIEAISWDVAIANVGGSANLWFGCSVVTVIQALFYISLCICPNPTKQVQTIINHQMTFKVTRFTESPKKRTRI